MTHAHRPRNPIAVALWVNAALLGTIAAVLLTRSGAPAFDLASPALAQNGPTLAGGAGVFVAPAQFGRDAYGAYLMDVDTQTLCVYQWDAANRMLRLSAARSFRFDRRLQNFNTENPSPLEVRDLVEKEAAAVRGAPPTPAAPALPAATRPGE